MDEYLETYFILKHKKEKGTLPPALTESSDLAELMRHMLRPSSKSSNGKFDSLLKHLRACLDSCNMLLMNLSPAHSGFPYLQGFALAIEAMVCVALEIKQRH